MAVLWIMFILVAALVIGTAIDRLMQRMGIHPADPDERAGGFRDVLRRLNTWLAHRKAERS